MADHKSSGYRSEIYQTGAARPWLVISVVMLIDWFAPILMGLLYPNFDAVTMSTLVFGYDRAPTYWLYKGYLVAYSLVIFYAAMDGYGYLQEAHPGLGRYVVAGLLVFALLPGFITGVMPYNVLGAENAIFSLPWVMIIIGYVALFIGGVALTQLVRRTGRSREAQLMLVFQVLTLVAGLAALVWRDGAVGLWQRLLNNLSLMPFIMFGLIHWSLDRDSLMEAAPVCTPRRLAASDMARLAERR